MKNIAPSRKQRSRTQIMDAARIEFDANGIDDVSMEAIARRAGLTRATVYNLFSSKEAIAAAIVNGKIEEWDQAFRTRINNNEDGLDLIRQALSANAKICHQHPNIAISVMTKPQKTALPEDGADRKSFRILIQDMIALCQTQGSIRQDIDTTHLMLVIMGLYIQMMLFALTSGSKITDQHIEQMLQLLIEGIGFRKTVS